jgi:hypothetical protein
MLSKAFPPVHDFGAIPVVPELLLPNQYMTVCRRMLVFGLERVSAESVFCGKSRTGLKNHENRKKTCKKNGMLNF